MLDIRSFILTAKELGLYVIVRPGPYICDEYDCGGFPAYLYKDKNMNLRCCDDKYLAYVKTWYARLFKEFVDLQITNGGNIIAMQIENEYGSYGNDKEYILAIKKIMEDLGANCLLFTADGGGNDAFVSGGGVPGVYTALTFGSRVDTAFDCLEGRGFGPKCCMEFWDGWFEHWFEKRTERSTEDLMKEMHAFLDNDISFNLCMFHGGTNFGFTAGANMTKYYEPTVTSYDYGAPVGEYGNYTEFYHALRKELLRRDGISEDQLPLPTNPKTQNIGKVQLTEFAGLKSNLDNLSKEIKSTCPLSFADMDMTNGYAYYTAEIKGRYTKGDDTDLWGNTSITLCNLNDLGYLYVDGEYKGRYWRNDAKQMHNLAMHDVKCEQFDGKKTVEVFVDAMGGVDYGPFFGEQKGLGALMIFQQYVYHWKCRALPMDNLDKLCYDGKKQVPCFMRGTFKAQKKDCFVKLDGFTKGFVTVNGRNLGRFWNVGPQQTLYLPGCWLKDGDNEIIVFEQEGYELPQVEIIDYPILNVNK
jgi:beta-galactosidase